MTDIPRLLDLDDLFSFHCHPGLPCFTTCCQDINIFLTPYDVLRMKQGLGISSTEFLAQYTRTVVAPQTALPAVQLEMDQGSGGKCYFVDETGCTIYQDRPWSCRMFPLDVNDAGSGFKVVGEPRRCQGFSSRQPLKVHQWLAEQGLEPYELHNRHFSELISDRFLALWRKTQPEATNIFYLACYDVDRFREVVFKERLFEMLDITPEGVHKLSTDDLALLEFAFVWLKTVAEHNADAFQAGRTGGRGDY